MKNKELNLAIKIREELNKKGAKLGNASDFIIENVLKEYSQLQTRDDVSQKTEIEISKVIQDIADGKVHPSTGSARLMIILKQPNNKVDALIEKQDEYIKFLGDYVDSITGYLSVHNMQASSEVCEKGEKLRKEIQDLKQIK